MRAPPGSPRRHHVRAAPGRWRRHLERGQRCPRPLIAAGPRVPPASPGALPTRRPAPPRPPAAPTHGPAAAAFPRAAAGGGPARPGPAWHGSARPQRASPGAAGRGQPRHPPRHGRAVAFPPLKVVVEALRSFQITFCHLINEFCPLYSPLTSLF